MMIGSRTAAWAKSGGWVNPYVTDGLVAMWDGEWNAGPEKHDSQARMIDLVKGSISIDFTGVAEVYSNHLLLVGSLNKTFGNEGRTFFDFEDITFETVYKNATGNGEQYIRYYLGSSYLQFDHYDSGKIHWVYSTFGHVNNRPGGLPEHPLISASFAGNHSVLNGSRIMRNGDENNVQTWNPTEGTPTNLFNIIVPKNNTGELYSIRIYNRCLSKQEQLDNFEVDKVRFGIT